MFRQLRRLGNLKWENFEQVAEKLFEKDKSLNPLTLRFTELQKMVAALPDFKEPAEAITEAKLEKIQMAWLEMYEDK